MQVEANRQPSDRLPMRTFNRAVIQTNNISSLFLTGGSGVEDACPMLYTIFSSGIIIFYVVDSKSGGVVKA